jgi:hypothetical protein
MIRHRAGDVPFAKLFPGESQLRVDNPRAAEHAYEYSEKRFPFAPVVLAPMAAPPV